MTFIPSVEIIQNIFVVLLVFTGVCFVLVGSVGLLRFPDFFTRLHAAGIIDTLGLELILLGLMVKSGFSLITLKLALVGFVLFLTSPTATHAITNAAYKAGLKPLLKRYRAPDPQDLTGDRTDGDSQKTQQEEQA